MLTFATFDVDVTLETANKVLSIEPNFIRYQPKELIKSLCSSARKFHPDCRTVVLTDRVSQFPGFPEEIEIVRYDIDTRQLTMSRTQAQIAFLKQSGGDTHIVFLDTDMLIQHSLKSLFLEEFDIALTYRKHHMPINGGVIILNSKKYIESFHFMSKLLEIIQKNYKDFQAWYGSQYALKDLVKVPESLEDEQLLVVLEEGIKVLLLPCSKYNFYTYPSNVMDGHYPDKVILHFKGTRKRFQVPYYEKYIRPLA